jgi:hypothetical protein
VKKGMEGNESSVRKMSPFLLAIVMISLILSLASIYEGIDSYTKNPPDYAGGSLFVTIGLTTLVIVSYLWLQNRRRMLRLAIEMPPVNTTIECKKCGFKNVRDFKQGDYIFKQTEDQCPKCNEKTMAIGSIFREVKEKGKAAEAGFS